jgi:hypothetical protein
MRSFSTPCRYGVSALFCCTTTIATPVHAEDPVAATAAPAAPVTVAATEEPAPIVEAPPTAEPPAAPAPVAETPTMPATPAPPAAVVDDATAKPLSAAAWGRISNVIQGRDREKLNDMSQAVEVDLLLGGTIHEHVGWQANFVATYGPRPAVDADGMPTGEITGDITGDASILDLIGQFEIVPEVNVWVGRMLVPSDRSNFSGAWFIAPWTYPGEYQAFAPPAGPRQGPHGRNDGATVWGDIDGGRVKYYAGAFDLFDPSQSPLFSTRVNIALLDREPGYYSSSSYYGKDIVSIGLGAQYKRDGSAGAMAVDDYAELNADVLYETRVGGGVLDLEAAFHLFGGDSEVLDNHFFVMASYLLPQTVGIGKLQPLVRFQGASPSDGGDLWRILEAQVGYIIAPYAARVALVYQRTDVADAASNAVIIGVQLQK